MLHRSITCISLFRFWVMHRQHPFVSLQSLSESILNFPRQRATDSLPTTFLSCSILPIFISICPTSSSNPTMPISLGDRESLLEHILALIKSPIQPNRATSFDINLQLCSFGLSSRRQHSKSCQEKVCG